MKKVNVKIVALIIIFIVVVVLFIKGGCLSGIEGKFSFLRSKQAIHSQTDGSREGEADDSDSEDETQEVKDARYLQLPIVNNVKDKDSYNSYSNEKLSWYIKRDKEHGPSGCDDTLELSEYCAYYLDKRVWEENSDKQQEKIMYFTFDCGYENGYTEQMLDILKEENVPACFFLTQTYIRDNIDIVKRMKSEGHQVGNHTITHPCLPNTSYEEIVHEINGCAEYMKEATGYDMDPYFRPPSGDYSARNLAIARDLGYKNIFWSIVYLDYDVNNQPGSDFVIEHFKKYHHNGAIVLMHNCSSSNAAALKTVIQNLKAEGYRFASLNELE